VHINGRTQSNFVGLSNGTVYDIASYDRSQPAVTRKMALAVTNAAGSVLFLKSDAGKSVTYKVLLLSVSNSGADRYSEYVVASDNSGSPASNWSIVPVLLGSSTVAGRLVITGSGDVEIRGNSVASVDIVAVILKLSNNRIYT